MFEPARRVRAMAVGLALAGLAAGCSVVPRSQLDDCHKQCQALQAESSQLKDATVRLRDQNRDYAQQAVDDARRLHTLEEANSRLEKSVVAYQDDIRRMEATVDQILRQVQSSADSPPTAALRESP